MSQPPPDDLKDWSKSAASRRCHEVAKGGDALLSPQRIFHIIGPPGTGQRKTTTLSRQARRAADTYGKDQVVIASLTRAAAAEVAGRDHGIPDENVGTLHAHAYRALDRPDLAETPEGVRAWNAAHPGAQLTARAQRDQLEDAPADADRPTDDHHARAHAQLMLLRARMTPRNAWPPDVLAHAREWDDFKQQTGRLDFADLIEKATVLGPHPHAPRGLFLDEAQDFSRAELALAHAWSANTDTTVLVHDPYQAIYSWRGADPQALLASAQHAPRVLDESYRVPRAVHAAAMQWIGRHGDYRHFAYQPRDHDGQVGLADATLDTPRRLLEHVDSGRDTMILATCGHMLNPLIKALRADGVPFHNPLRSTHGGWNPLRGAHRLAAYLRADPRVWGDRARCWTWSDLKDWVEPLDARSSLTRGAKTLIDSKCEVDRFGESRADTEVPLDTIAELLGTEDLSHPALHLDVDWWFDHLRATKRATHAYPVAVCRRRGGRALVETPRLVVGTVHSVKGGEAADVILAPDLSRAGTWEGWHPGGAGRDAIIRLFYVGMTRARDRLTVLEPSGPDHVPMALLGDGLERVA